MTEQVDPSPLAQFSASEDLYRAMFEDAPIGIWVEDFSRVKASLDALRAADVTDLASYFTRRPGEVARLAGEVRILDINHTGVLGLQATSKDEVLRHLPSFFTAGSMAVFQEELLALASGRTRFRVEMPHLDAAGEPRVLDLHVAVQAGHEATLSRVLIYFLDITDRKHAEETEIRARKAESLVLMAGSIAHDFNNLFAALLASVEIVELQSRDRPEVVSTLITAKEVLRRAVTLSWKMLDFSGRAITRMEPINLGEQLPGWIQNLDPRRPGRSLELDLRALPPIQGDPAKLQKVLKAILKNAWEAMDVAGMASGRVRLGLTLDQGEEPAQGLWAAPRPAVPATVCLEVGNDGPCPPPEVLARMFDPFFTTHTVGRGLGLASALGLLQAHSAGLQVLPGGDRGLTFRLHFPPAAGTYP